MLYRNKIEIEIYDVNGMLWFCALESKEWFKEKKSPKGYVITFGPYLQEDSSEDEEELYAQTVAERL